MESNSESTTATNSAYLEANSQLIEDLCQIQLPLTDEIVINPDWQKLRSQNFSNSFEIRKFPEDETIIDTISNRHLSEKLVSSEKTFDSLEYHTLISKPEQDKIYNFQDLLKNDCDILSLCKNYQERDHDNGSSDDLTRQHLRNKKTNWAFSQDSLLPNVQEWLFNVTSDKNKNHFQANSISEMNNAIAGLQSIGNLNSYSSSILKNPTLIHSPFKVDQYKYDNKDHLTNFFINSNIVTNQKNYDTESSNNNLSNKNKVTFNIEDNSSIHNKFILQKNNNGKQKIPYNVEKSILTKNIPNEEQIKHKYDDFFKISLENDSKKNFVEDNTIKSLNGNIKVKPIKVFSKKKPIPLNLSSEETTNLDIGTKKKVSLAMVTFTQDYSTENIKVSIISSNKKQTVFKIHTKNVIQAVSSIKESSLKSLGLKSEQMFIIASEASGQFHSNLKPAMEKLSNKTVEVPNLSVSHYINEDFSIADESIPIICTDKPTNISVIKLDNNPENEIKSHSKTYKINYKKDNLNNQRNCNLSESNMKTQRNLVSNVGFSLLAGSSPTMVSQPSVLDSLAVSAESKRSLVSENKLLKILEELGITLDSLEFYSSPHKKKSWRCPINDCLKTFVLLYKLKVHILNHDGIRPYKCSYDNCDWSFCTRYKLKRHLETHLKRKDFACNELSCNKRFTTIYNLNAHMQLHQKPKVCVCTYPDCNSAFENQKELEMHMYHHGGHKHPYRCKVDGCVKGFFTPSSLALHSRSHHNDEDLKCKWEGCCKKFDKPSRLKMHMRIHTGVRPYTCKFKYCSSTFNCASKLSRHQKRHTNDRKHICSVCKKAFLRSEHLTGHLLTHTGVRHFQCPIPDCEANFTAKSSLYVHVKKHKSTKTDGKDRNGDTNNRKTLPEENHSCSTPYFAADCQQLDYITLIEDKELSSDSHFQNAGKSPSFSTVVPLSFQHDSASKSHDKHLHTLSSQDAVLMQFLDVSSGMTIPLDAPEPTISLTVSDNLFPPTMTLAEDQSHLALDLGFLDVHHRDPRDVTADFKKKGYSHSRGIDTLNSFSFSQKAKQRSGREYSRYSDDCSLKSDFSGNDVILSDIVNDHTKLMSLQDASTNVFYPDSLITEDILNYPSQPSTINLRDLE